MNRRNFNKNIGLTAGLIGVGALHACGSSSKEESEQKDNGANATESKVSPELAKRMYDKALAITKSKVRGGNTEPFFKKPFIDAAFNGNIFLWDSCFMCCFCKYHMDELPVYQALDNFYKLDISRAFLF